ncbi:F-box only protein 5 [Hemiscyllium ocellatum]|uniref:F-box only protein 5 n=1 Tax=Hemiscyllium ocellatum TaxID=170820 RepID=UPI0029665698|nr:F-box only protein 5 [Hemiscyllium ocellatum]
MKYTSRVSHWSNCLSCTVSSACSNDNDNMKARSWKTGSLQRDSNCPQHCPNTGSPDSSIDARISSSAVDKLTVAVPSEPQPKLVVCSYVTSESNLNLSPDSGLLSPDSGYLSQLNQSSLSVEEEGNLVQDGDHRIGGSSEDLAHEGEQLSGKKVEDPATASPTQNRTGDPGLEAKPSEKNLALTKWQRLPALQVGWAVCQSMGRVKGKLRVDKSLLKETLRGQVFTVDNLIGRKMGLEYVDIWKELLDRGFPNLLKIILRFLTLPNLLNCVKVSKTWKRIVYDDKRASQLLRNALHLQRLSGADSLGDTAVRRNVVSRGVLSSVQRVGVSSPQKCLTQPSSPVKLNRVSQRSIRHQQVVKTLKQDETLKTCPLCASPAIFTPCEERAICSNANCSYDYCSLCFDTFHGSKECARRHYRNHSKSQPQAGSKKSKRNLKRL